MNILIVGGLGFLGKNLSKELSKWHQVFIVDVVDACKKNYFKAELSDTEKIKCIMKY